jgi:serine/threonine-protein kinase RsbW
MDQPRMELRLPPGTAEVASLLDAVEAFAEEAELPTPVAMRLALVAEELATNVTMHGAGASFFAFAATVTPAGVAIAFEDDGPEFNPLAAAPAATGAAMEAREVGGLGLHLVRSLTRAAEHRRAAGHNHLACLLPTDA